MKLLSILKGLHMRDTLPGLLLFLLILQGCAPTPQQVFAVPSSAHKEVLFVLSAASTQRLADGKERETGYFLNEFVEPLARLREQGYEVSIATPGARAAVIDPESLDPDYWSSPEAREAALTMLESLEVYHDPLSLEQALSSIDRLSEAGGDLSRKVSPRIRSACFIPGKGRRSWRSDRSGRVDGSLSSSSGRGLAQEMDRCRGGT